MTETQITQADIDAAQSIWHRCDDGPYCELPQWLVQAFARHRLATRTDATPVAEVEALRGSISIMETALQQIAGTHAERFGTCQTDVEEVPDLSAEEAVSIARNALKTTGDTHPPATDVAALVEAAKGVADILQYECDVPPCVGSMAPAEHALGVCRQALAPFTKGQNDD